MNAMSAPAPRLSIADTLLLMVAGGIQRTAEKSGKPVPNDIEALGQAIEMIAAYDAERGA
jgi:hypothetical protein